MDRQDPFQLSSSRRRHRDVSPTPQNARPKSIGCMSAVFRFLSKHNRRRRFLISGKKQESEVSNSLQPTPSSPPRNSSSDAVFRSPTLPANMRSVYAFSPSPENLSSHPALVARLMGLNEVPMVAGVKLTVAEKRRRLLGALEKCDEDLKALKSMIQLITSVGDKTGKIDCREAEESELEASSCGGLSSTVAELTRLNLYASNAGTNGGGGLQQLKKKPGEEENTNISFIERVKKETINYTKEKTNERFGLGDWGSKAMEESVNEVCRDIDWGQKREIGRIGVALQDFICRDLIEETVIDFGFCCTGYQPPQPLPLESCKRMLRF